MRRKINNVYVFLKGGVLDKKLSKLCWVEETVTVLARKETLRELELVECLGTAPEETEAPSVGVKVKEGRESAEVCKWGYPLGMTLQNWKSG